MTLSLSSSVRPFVRTLFFSLVLLASVVYFECHKMSERVSRNFQGCFKEVLRTFWESFEGVSRNFQGCFKEVLRVFQESFKKVSRMF